MPEFWMLSDHQMLELCNNKGTIQKSVFVNGLVLFPEIILHTILEHRDTFYSSILTLLQVLCQTAEYSKMCGPA